MLYRPAILAALSATLAISAPARVSADAGDIIKGLGAAAIICGMTNCLGSRPSQAQPQPQQPSRTTTSQPVRRAPPVADQTVMRDQNALNYFGFPAGSADGRMGNNTRNAIRDYQDYMGYSATGQLSNYERQALHTAYDRVQAGGGAAYPDVVAAEGSRGLIKAFAAEQRGERYQPFNTAAQAPQPQFQPPQQQQLMPTPAPQTNQPGSVSGLPSFGLAPSARSMAGHCQSVDLLTQANGGTMRPDTITNADQALDEQFCAARGYAMSRAQQLLTQVEGMTDADLQNQCKGLVQTMAPMTAKVATSPAADTVVTQAASFAAGLGAPRDQLVNIGEICMGIGYQTDDADVVLASTMLLIGAGGQPYAETYGHHLRQGFGLSSDPALGTAWYRQGLGALDAGQAPVFLPAQGAQRAAVIRAALEGVNATPTAAPLNAAIQLPSFGAASN